jgi:hypothetical protein
MARVEGFFDDLARGLADGTLSRGKALRLMGAALLGGTLGSLGIGEASADRPGCKRIGKNCTRDTQCCGSLVCVSETCQAQATTTTTSSTTSTSTSTTSTSTTTPTTSTSTSTTSTSTTPMCLPNGVSCTSNTDCCRGRCASGACAEPCPAGTVLLDNGTCATACTSISGTECSGCAACHGHFSGGVFDNTSYCRGPSEDNPTPCQSDLNCPTGYFCGGVCVTACSPG